MRLVVRGPVEADELAAILAVLELHDAPALLIQLQDELSISRKREAFWISVAVHLILIIFIEPDPLYGMVSQAVGPRDQAQ